jgi:hypothetical protein
MNGRPQVFLGFPVALAASAGAQQAPIDRKVLPVPEPSYPAITETDARRATAPPRFGGTMKGITVGVVAGFALASPLRGQQPAAPAAQAQDLARQLSNPVADLVSIPLQFNWDNGVGPDEATRLVLNIQPVVPFSLGERWNLIGRFIVPVIGQPPLTAGGAATFGTGDIVMSAFFSPKGGGTVWGVGPVFGLPTVADPALGSGKWSVGPTAVVLSQRGPWTFGGLVNHLWSVADATSQPRSDVTLTLIQPFLAYATAGGVTFGLNSEATANWEAASGEEWTVPILVQVSKVTRLGPFPFQIGVGGGPYVERPTGGPEWKLRMNFVLILPQAK